MSLVKETLRTLETKIAEANSEARGAEQAGYSQEDRLRHLFKEREEIYSRLAEMWLPSFERDGFRRKNSAMHARAQEIFDSKQRKRKEGETAIYEAEQEKLKLEVQVDEFTSQIHEKEEKNKDVENFLTALLSESKEYMEAQAVVDTARARIERHQARVAEFEEDKKEKLARYDADGHFADLMRKGFGTSGYQSTTHFTDRVVALFTGFMRNYADYTFLKETMPTYLKEEGSRLESELDKVMEKVLTIRQAEAKNQKITDLAPEIRELIKKRRLLAEQGEQIDAKIAAYQKDLQVVDDKTPYERQALQEFTDYLKGEGLARLVGRARESDGDEDNQLVNQLMDIEREIQTQKIEANTARHTRDESFGRARAYKSLKGELLKGGYDSMYSSFGRKSNLSEIITSNISNINDIFEKDSKGLKEKIYFKL